MSTRDAHRIIICGGGMAGLCAAVTALQAGACVTLIEKAPQLGGTAAMSGGLIWTFSDFDQLRRDIPDGDPVLQWLVFDGADAGRSWLESLGVRLGPEQLMLGHGRGRAIEPPQAIGTLADHVRSLGGEVRLATALESLLVVDGAVVGVRAVSEGRTTDLYGSAVILATGGFQGNPELLTRYGVADPDNLYLRASPWSTGDGFIAATRAGAAATSGLNTFYGHALAAPPARFNASELRDVSQYYGPTGVAINMQGERFADESDGTGEEALNQRLARQPRGLGFYIVDQALLDHHPVQGYEIVTHAILDRARDHKAPVIVADTLDDLVEGLGRHGVPRMRARQEIDQFNLAILEGRAEDLRPARRRNHHALTTPPFHAVGVKASITFTMGGLAIDEQTRVLRRAGGSSPLAPVPITRAFQALGSDHTSIGTEFRMTPIRGLYAAGCDTGNVSHFGYMGGLCTALATGRVAGREAALPA